MPYRKTPHVNGEFYHVFNRSIYRQPIFNKKRDNALFLKLMQYYQQINPPIKFSYYRRNPKKYVIDLTNKLVTIISYCLMPNHFHMTLRQDHDNGVRKFMQKVLNSYSHFISTKYSFLGPLFESPFKSKRVESDEQLIHLSRYHHLNPVTVNLVEHPKDYPYSSFKDYMSEKPVLVDPESVLINFKTTKDYEKFVLVRKQYQRELAQIKHLLFE